MPLRRGILPAWDLLSVFERTSPESRRRSHLTESGSDPKND